VIGSTGAPTRRPRAALGSALRDTGAVLAMALRLLWRHWPVLLALFLTASGVREIVLVVAVHASDLNGVLGFLVLVLAPIATLTALVLMLRVVRPSLPTLGATGAGAGLLDRLGSVLVPFLAVYASYGYLRRDTSEYVYRVWKAETLDNADLFSGSGRVDVAHRLPFTLGVVLVVVVAVAVTLRWLLGRWAAAQRSAVLGLLGAYVEVVWITLVAGVFTQLHGAATGWLADRRIVHWLTGLWNAVTGALGPLTDPVRGTGSWLGSLVGDADVVILVPFAWLAVGAVVYGYRLAGSSARGPGWGAPRWVPEPVRAVAGNIAADVRGRFAPLIDGLRLLVRAGVAPMLLFCLAFVVAQTASSWLWELERLVVGPQDLNTVWRPLSGALSVCNDAAGTVVLACVLAAAVDRVLRVPGMAVPVPVARAPERATQPAMSRA
jgi:hypothetical protein